MRVSSANRATRVLGSRRRLGFLIGGMAVIGFSVLLVTFLVLYRAAFEGQRSRLVETVRSRARLIESVASFDRTHNPEFPGGPSAATLEQITEAHENFESSEGTGEFTLARLEGGLMVFLLIHGATDSPTPTAVPIESQLAEPMRRALRGESGTVVGLDYRGIRVLAAYEPVVGLSLGVVAKVDLAEIRAPFLRAGSLALIAGIVLISIGAFLFRAIIEPLLAEVWTSEQKFRSLFERSIDAIAIVGNDGLLIDANEAVDVLLGYERGELLGTNVKALYADPERREEFIQAVSARGSVRDFEAKFLRKDGTEIVCLLTAAARTAAEDEIPGHVTIVRDVTETKRTEDMLRYQATMLSSMADAVVTTDPDFAINSWNLGAEKMYGLRADEMLGKTMAAIGDIQYPQTTRDEVLASLRKDGYWSGEAVHTNREGRSISVMTVATFVEDDAGEPIGVVAVHRDISERVRIEQELRAERNRAQQYLDVASVMLVVLDVEGRVTLINRKGLEILGYSDQEELLGSIWFETCLPVEHATQVKEVFEHVMSGDSGQFAFYENPIVTGSGEQRMIAWRNALLTDENGSPVGVLSSGEDITERQRAEEALRTSEAEYRDLFDNATYGIYRSNPNGKFTAVNSALVKMLRYGSAEELLGIDISRDLYFDEAERARLISLQEVGEGDFQEEVQWLRKDGEPITVLLKGRSIRGSGGTIVGFEAMAEDVTQQRKLEGQLRQAQKMEAIGQLTGGIAHDFNNELLVILLNIQMLSDSIEQGETPRLDELGDIAAAANRATEMTRQLVGFSRRAALKPQPTNLARRVKKLSKMLVRILPAHIRVLTEADESVESVLVDPNSVEQMLLNLVTNARYAMPDGGDLKVRVWESDLDEAYCRKYPPTTPGRYVLVAVTDTGVGMDAATQSKIFEPFFTTRSVGEGTGLGMAMVYGLTKQQKGFVHIDSELGQGTTVTLAFPVVADQATITTEHKIVTDAVGGTETILFVDDEQALRRAGRRVLESQGYTVATACDGNEALETLRSQPSEFDLVISDLMMPNMNGVELCTAMEQDGIKVPFIIASGYSHQDVQAELNTKTDVPIVRKPWTVAEMLTVVRTTLDGT